MSVSDESSSDHLAASRDGESHRSPSSARASGSERAETGGRQERPASDRSGSSTSQSQPYRETSSHTSSVHSPKSGKITPPFRRTAPDVEGKATNATEAVGDVRAFWGAQAGLSTSASSQQQQQQLQPTPASSTEELRSTVVAQARRAVQDIADQIRALEGASGASGNVSVASSAKSSRYSVFVGGLVPDEAYMSQQ